MDGSSGGRSPEYQPEFELCSGRTTYCFDNSLKAIERSTSSKVQSKPLTMAKDLAKIGGKETIFQMEETRSQRDGEMTSAVEFDNDFLFRDFDGGWHIEQVAEDL